MAMEAMAEIRRFHLDLTIVVMAEGVRTCFATKAFLLHSPIYERQHGSQPVVDEAEQYQLDPQWECRHATMH